MHWVTITWSMVASACFTLAMMHLIIWLKQRSRLTHLLFFLAAMGVAGIALGELMLMRSQTPEQYGLIVRWIHVPLFLALVSTTCFVQLYLGSGRLWLACTVCALRLSILIINFLKWPNFNFTTITGLQRLQLWGNDTVSVARGVVSPWTRFSEASSILFLVYVLDATLSPLWREIKVDRRRVALVGGSLSLFALISTGHTTLLHEGFVRSPYLISVSFMAPLIVMAYELSSDVVRTGLLTQQLEGSQTQLRETEEQMSLAADASGLGLWEWDSVADQIRTTEQSRKLFGLNSAERINLHQLLANIDPDDREAVHLAMTHSIGNGGEYQQEYRVLLPDGQRRWLTSRGRARTDGGRQRVLMRAVSIDISERKLAEERFRLAVEAVPSALIMVNSQRKIVLVNAQTELIFRYSRNELVGRSIEPLILGRSHAAHPDHRGSYFADSLQRAIGSREQLFAVRKDGSEVPVEVGLNPIQTPEGMFALVSIVDVTQRRQAEREAAVQRNELAHLARVTMLGELSGSLAHELNQPLTAILSNAQAAQRFLAQNPSNPGELHEILKDIIDANNRASETIRRLRLLFKKGEVQNQMLDINTVVKDVLKIMNSDLINNMVTTQTELQADLPDVQGDRVQLQQVLINLIINACDAMTGTKPEERRVLCRSLYSGNGEIHVVIVDHGCGIPPDGFERVFEPFVTTKHNGMGLGLSVCRKIVAAHGGRLWATNNPDSGASVHVALPIPSSAAL
jgi:two-component system, LuxR family, sensor kinase FixL